MGVGTANIRARVGEFTANCTVIVEPTLAESISLNYQNSTLQIGQTLNLTATVSPSSTTDQTITWTSSDSNVASVSINGEVTALTEGTTIITAECGSVSASCNIKVEPIPSTGVVLNYSAVTMKTGLTQQLVATIYPDNTTNKEIAWTSSASNVASVSSDGLITALTVGTTTITASNGGNFATCEVTVEPVFAQQLILDKYSLTINVNDFASLSASILPENVTDNTISWTSLDDSVATVSNGVVKGVAPGSTVVTAECGAANASCVVTVLQPATSITLNETSLDLFVGDLYDLIETVEPINTTDIVVWTSSDSNVATVDENGIINAIKAGETTITATCGIQSASCVVKVSDIAATAVVLDVEELTLKKGQSQQLTATVIPENTTFPIIIWTSGDTSIATVAEDGTVTAVGAGTTSITATCGEIYGTCSITVEDPESDEVVLNYTTYILKAEETLQLEIVNHDNIEGVIWSSSSENVASVSTNGLVTAIAVGETIITVTYNGKSSSCSVSVVATEAELVELNYNEILLEVEETCQLVATVSPETTTDAKVIWKSNNEKVATVSEDGLVTAISIGSAIITAECGNVFAFCSVNVEGKTSSLESLGGENYDGTYKVFTLQGLHLLTTSQLNDIYKLAPGFYIVNGKKIVIR